ncbi:MAG: hypothetical protein KGL43_04135 [Burkholderiales bacterium]|nr:hypothetical protein [Burkholderiales bacterium]
MTNPRSTYRGRRRQSTDELPRALVAWFAGERQKPPMVSALLYPGDMLLPERWAAWSAEHPGVRPPAGWEWLADPGSSRHPAPERVARAKAFAAAGWRGGEPPMHVIPGAAPPNAE